MDRDGALVTETTAQRLKAIGERCRALQNDEVPYDVIPPGEDSPEEPEER